MANVRTGRIIRSISGFYDVRTGDKVISCRARGILRKTGESPLTGDMVEITVEKGKGMVERILPRRNSFVRPAVANIDTLVVFAANVNPVTEPFLIDRVAAIAGDQEVPVYVCINKCDSVSRSIITKIGANVVDKIRQIAFIFKRLRFVNRIGLALHPTHTLDLHVVILKLQKFNTVFYVLVFYNALFCNKNRSPNACR